MARLSEARLTEILRACLLSEGDARAFKFPGIPADRDARAKGENLPAYFYWLDAARVATFRSEVVAALASMPDEFMDNGGGGWSFLNFCTLRDGTLWTGLQRSCEELIALGAALGLCDWMMPRDLWDALPGAVPYVVIKRSAF